MSLELRNVLVFAATGDIGSGTARRLAADGATVWLSGRREAPLDELAEELRAAGGTANVDVVDATDEQQVTAYVDRVADRAGSVDGVFNAIGMTPADGGFPAHTTGLATETFLRPLQVITGSTFLTAKTAARHMAAQGRGSIVTLSAALSGSQVPFLAALTATCGAVEALTRALATELGPAGVRVNCVRADAMPQTRSIGLTAAGMQAIGIPAEEFAQSINVSPLGRPTSVAETAATVAFLLSDAASGISYQTVNVTSRALAG